MTTDREPGVYPRPDGGVDVIVDLDESCSYVEDMWPDEADLIASRAVAARNAEIAESVRDQAQWLSSCRCATINPKFGEGQPGGHFTDCDWAFERDVREEIVATVVQP